MIEGIPYFGDQTQRIVEQIHQSEIVNTIEYKDVYTLIISNITDPLVVIIDNQWITWLNDIEFNYRDKKIILPYYTYNIYKLNDAKHHRSNYKGHLILKDNTLYIRYNYTYRELELHDCNISLTVYNIESNEKLRLEAHTWLSDTRVDMNKLYKLYIESSFKEDDFLYNKHSGGYHYITKFVKNIKNTEQMYRKQLELDDYTPDNIFPTDYRDVRNYKYDEIITNHGLVSTIELYKIRRLRFEVYLYCSIRASLISKEYPELGKTKRIVKYGNTLKLIIKDYWLDNTQLKKPNKTWSRNRGMQ